MKKFLQVVVLVLSLVFLASCDLFNKPPKKEELELTVGQMQELMQDIDFTELSNDIVVLKGDVDLRLGVLFNSEDLEEPAEGEANFKGDVKLYINLTTFEESYIYGDFDISLNIDLNPLDFSDDIDEEELVEFNKFKNLSLKGQAYLVKGVLYVNATFKQGGTEVSLKQYEQLFTQEEFDLAKEAINTEIQEADFNQMLEDMFEEILMDMPEIDLEEDIDGLTLKAYQVGDSYLFEARTDDDLKDTLEELLGLVNADGDVEIELIGESEFDNYASLQFSNKLEKIGVHSKTDFKIRVSDEVEGITLDLALYLEANFTIDFQGKMPKGLPKEGEFDGYDEGIDLSILFGSMGMMGY